MSRYILSIDQSTQGTKALLFDECGALVCRADRPHRQIIDARGWVEHDPEEIIRNTIQVAKDVVERAGIDKSGIVALGLSNQRETSVTWDRATGKPVYNAIVWQCARGAAICEALERQGCGEMVRRATGLRLSPYFPAAKLAWIMQNVEGVAERAGRGEICVGTVDSWLVYNLSLDRRHRTDYSNASRTQLFNINTPSNTEAMVSLSSCWSCSASIRGACLGSRIPTATSARPTSAAGWTNPSPFAPRWATATARCSARDASCRA